jgi:uncharacterized protein YwqG
MGVMTEDAAQEPGDESTADTKEEALRLVLDQLKLPCAAIALGGVPGPTDSYLAGSPYLPAGHSWPVDEHGPQLFVGQINWAQVPGLPPAYPTSGLLQWFVSADDTYGLTFGDDQGAVGFTVRWFDDLDVPSQLEPDAAPLTGADADHPLDLTGPTRLTFRAGVSVPGWTDLPVVLQEAGLWAHWAELEGDDPAYPGDAFDTYSRRPEFLPENTVLGSKVGGYATTVQGDPRGTGAYPLPGHDGEWLLVELNSDETGGWGDGGIAHLFGQPDDVAAGDLSLIRYHWDCD